MMYFARWKQLAIVAVVLLGALLCLPNFFPKSALPNWARQFSLGLDLRGGSYLLLEVDMAAVVRERLESLADGARGKLRAANIGYVNLAADAPNRRLSLRVRDPGQAAAANEAFKVILDEPWRIQKLNENTKQFIGGLKSRGFNTLLTETAIVCTKDKQRQY